MGQYYKGLLIEFTGDKPVESAEDLNRDDVNVTIFSPWVFNSGSKLVEFGEMMSSISREVLHRLKDARTKKQMIWVGDYSNDTEGESGLKNALYEIAWGNKETQKEAGVSNVSKQDASMIYFNKMYGEDVYICANHRLKSFVRCRVYDRFFAPILLTALGNGAGGGDYWYDKSEEVGAWALDRISIHGGGVESFKISYPDYTEYVAGFEGEIH